MIRGALGRRHDLSPYANLRHATAVVQSGNARDLEGWESADYSRTNSLGRSEHAAAQTDRWGRLVTADGGPSLYVECAMMPKKASPPLLPARAALSKGRLHRAVVDGLALEIVRGKYPPEAPLPVEAELASALAVGRSSLRRSSRRCVTTSCS